MEDAGGQGGVGPALDQGGPEVLRAGRAPPEATTGIVTASLTARVIGRSYPFLVPSASMLVRTISPAPSRSTSRAQATASRPVGTRPPLMWTSQTSRPSRSTRFGSMFTTMHWLPKRRAALRTNSGSRTAAELIEGGADAALAASIFHYREYTIAETKEYLARHGVPVRLMADSG